MYKEPAMCSNPFSSMKPANTCDIGRIAHLPFQTKYDAATSATIAKISSDNQLSNVKVVSGSHGYLARIAITVGL